MSAPEFTVDASRAVPTAVVKAFDIAMDDLPGLFDTAFPTLFPALATAGVTPAGAAFALYPRFSEDWSHCDIEVGVPLAAPLPGPVEAPLADGSAVVVEPSELPPGKVASSLYAGGYDGLGEAWKALTDALIAAGHTPAMPCWEVYLTEPTPDGDPADMRTGLNTRVK